MRFWNKNMHGVDGGGVALGDGMHIRESGLRAWRKISGEENVFEGWDN